MFLLNNLLVISGPTLVSRIGNAGWSER